MHENTFFVKKNKVGELFFIYIENGSETNGLKIDSRWSENSQKILNSVLDE